MINWPPPDVSLRIGGNDTQAAQALFPDAATLLYRALHYQSATGATNVNFRQPRTDGALVEVRLAGEIKIVTVTPAPSAPPPVEKFPEPPVPEEVLYFFYQMYSGIVRPTSPATLPQVASISNPEPPPSTLKVLDQFHPDEVCAGAYNLAMEWQQPEKLAVKSDGTQNTGNATSAYPKPGMYSGSMKRVVQAILGIGKQPTETVEFISEELPATYPDALVSNRYSPSWLKTHGIHKATDGSVWLVEIGKDNGVLAMPLPIFDGTDSYAFMAFLDSLGDTDTLNVVLEFGGLPTGEPFPSGADLTDAIAAGKVLQLLTDADVEPFYRDTVNSVNTSGLFNDCGWAFSESGAKADNIAFWYKNAAVVLADVDTWGSDGHNEDPAEERYKTARHCRITLALSSTPAEGFPYGTGSAILLVVEEQLLVGDYPVLAAESRLPEQLAMPMIRVPGINSEFLSLAAIYGRMPLAGTPTADALLAAELGYPSAPVFCFYRGETLEMVRWYHFGNHVNDNAPASLWGDTLDPFDGAHPPASGSSSSECIGLVVPAYMREAYLLVWPGLRTGNNSWDTFPVNVIGLFEGLGTVTFDTITEFYRSDLVFPGVFDMFSWPGLWLSQGNPFVSIAEPWPMFFGAVVNAGPTLGYFLRNTLGMPYNRILQQPGSILHERDGTGSTINQPASIADLEVPTDVTPRSLTFVGSV